MSNNLPLTILLAEDSPAAVALITQFVAREGHQLLVADNGQQAVDYVDQYQPDLILMDINMPVMNGIEAIKIIRAMDIDIWVPIIVLSALSSKDDVIAGFNAGADFYIAKPVNLDILSAKLKAMQRVVALEKQNKQAALKLLATNAQLEQENTLAKKLTDKMLDFGQLQHEALDYWLCPNQDFSGDLIAAADTVGGKLVVMLADSAGHGLSAALPTLLIARSFHAMTAKGFNLSSIVTEMNQSAKRLLPVDRFVAISLFAIDFNQHTIEYWNGGLPTALLVDNDGNISHKFESKHMAIGVLPMQQFNATTELYQWHQNSELIIYSDGLTESENPQGTAFGEAALIELIKNSPAGQRITTIKQTLLNFLQQDVGNDDISLITIRCAR